MKNMRDLFLGAAAFFTTSLAVTSCHEPVRNAQVTGFDLKSNPNRHYNFMAKDTLILNVEKAKSDTLLIFCHNADITGSEYNYKVGTLSDVRHDMYLGNTHYMFNPEIYQNVKTALDKEDLFYGPHKKNRVIFEYAAY